MIILGTPMILLGEWLGASAFIIGLAFSALYLSLPVQVLGTATLHIFGYKKQMIFCWATRGLAIVGLLVLVIMARNGPKPWMCCVYIACAWFFCILRAAGNSGVNPWMYSFIPPEVRGRYFATDQTMSSVCGIMVLLLVSSVFVSFETFFAFAICLCIALLGSISSTTALTFWPDAPLPGRISLSDMVRRVPALCLKPSPYRTYLIITTIWWFMISPITPFGSYYLKTESNLDHSVILIYSTIQYVGTLAGAFWISKRLDRHGVKYFFFTSLVCFTLLGIYWILLVYKVPIVLHFAGVAFFLLGLGNSFFYSPNLKYLPQVCPANDQALAIALNIAMTGVAAGISPIVWGFFVKRPGGTGMLMTPFLVYLGLLIITQFVLIGPYNRLLETEGDNPELPAAFIIHLRFHRYASHILSHILGPLGLMDEEDKDNAGSKGV
jgi:hypothetical protein